jgi:hypothetical protein
LGSRQSLIHQKFPDILLNPNIHFHVHKSPSPFPILKQINPAYKNDDLLVDSHNNLIRWKSYFSQILNVHSVSDFMQIEVQTAESLVLDPSPMEAETAISELE